jgi:hypothetical protein
MVTVEDGVFGVVADVDIIVSALDRMERALATPTAVPPKQAPAAAPELSGDLGDWSI